MITTIPFVQCTNCLKQTNIYYHDFKEQICETCLITQYNNEFPKGKGVYLPCSKCQSPQVVWYYQSTYGNISYDCGFHNNDSDDSDDILFEW